MKKHGPPDRVRLTRYRIGLVMFVFPAISYDLLKEKENKIGWKIHKTDEQPIPIK